jgi:hypothetical protein
LRWSAEPRRRGPGRPSCAGYPARLAAPTPDGGDTGGPISNAWQVRGWPTLVVIDAKGIVRHRFEGAPQGQTLDNAVEALLKENGGRLRWVGRPEAT